MIAGTLIVLSACGSRPPLNSQAQSTNQQRLPEAIRVPAGHKAVLEAQGRGNLLYECQAVRRAPYEYAWLLRSPSIKLEDTYGRAIMYYPGPRSRWVHDDGSQVLAREFVETAGDPQNLPLQRATAEPSAVRGALENVTYVQSVRTHGGMVTEKPCTAAGLGMRVSVPYEADYVFWRPVS
jgi:hypothetical protein